eukprot:scaffold3229_cov246-Pinguiococcus_pyrenoidosus.AAC.4
MGATAMGATAMGATAMGATAKGATAKGTTRTSEIWSRRAGEMCVRGGTVEGSDDLTFSACSRQEKLESTIVSGLAATRSGSRVWATQHGRAHTTWLFQTRTASPWTAT